MTTMMNDPMHEQHMQPQPQPRSSHGKKIGCGCLIIVLILIAVCGGAGWWVYSTFWGPVKEFQDKGYTLVMEEAIVVTQPVSEPRVYFSGKVTIKADCSADVAIVSGEAEVFNEIHGNLDFFGGALTIHKDAVIHGDLIVKGAGTILIEGEVLGEITGEYGQLIDNRAAPEGTPSPHTTPESADEDS